MNKRDEMAEAHGNRLFQSGETYLDSKCGHESFKAGWDAAIEECLSVVRGTDLRSEFADWLEAKLKPTPSDRGTG